MSDDQDPCEGGAHCCCCGPGDKCCDCGEIMPVAGQLAGAIAELRENQRQLDEDGVEVGVSREALDIVLAMVDETGGG